MELLEEALKIKGIPVLPEMIDQFSEYRRFLLLWNQRINLISRNDESRIVTKHFLGSLGLVKMIHFPFGATVLDLGTGAGFPGIPLKIIRPDIHLLLVESKRKKILFLNMIIEKLNLSNVEVILGRMEEIAETLKPVHFVISRSVTDLISLMKWSSNCIDPKDGILVAIKGPAVREELNRLSKRASVLGVTGWQLEKYDPFPSIMQLRETYIVAIQKSNPPRELLLIRE